MKGSLHVIAAARPAAIDIDLNRLGDRVSFAFRRSCRCHGFSLHLSFPVFIQFLSFGYLLFRTAAAIAEIV